jgi:hypothetical protein
MPNRIDLNNRAAWPQDLIAAIDEQRTEDWIEVITVDSLDAADSNDGCCLSLIKVPFEAIAAVFSYVIEKIAALFRTRNESDEWIQEYFKLPSRVQAQVRRAVLTAPAESSFHAGLTEALRGADPSDGTKYNEAFDQFIISKAPEDSALKSLVLDAVAEAQTISS